MARVPASSLNFGLSLLVALVFRSCHAYGFEDSLFWPAPASGRRSSWRRAVRCRSTRAVHRPSLADDAVPEEEAPILSMIPPPPPISMPVWSMAAQRASASINTDDGDPTFTTFPRTSMNIVTLTTPASVAPPKLWVVSLYHGTLTKDSFCRSGCGVLQLLTPRHKALVDVLGKHSGYDDDKPPAAGSNQGRVPPYNKHDECDRQGFPWVDGRSWTQCGNLVGPSDLIPGCASYVLLKHLGKQLDAGDHVAILCKVVATGRWDDDKQTVVDVDLDLPVTAMDHHSALYTGQLRDEGLL